MRKRRGRVNCIQQQKTFISSSRKDKISKFQIYCEKILIKSVIIIFLQTGIFKKINILSRKQSILF